MSFYFKERNVRPKPTCPKCDSECQDMIDYLLCPIHLRIEKPIITEKEEEEDDLELIGGARYGAAYGSSGGSVKKAYKSTPTYDIVDLENGDARGERTRTMEEAWNDDS